jgi:dephospho-CoA kinase
MTQIIAITGLCGSGKTEVARFLERRLGFVRFSLGDVFRREFQARHIDQSAASERAFQIQIRQERTMAALAILSEPSLREILNATKHIVIESICSWAEITHIRSTFSEHQLRSLSIHSPLIDRVKRLRDRPDRPMDQDEIHERDTLELASLEKGLSLSWSDYHLINDDTLQVLEERVLSLVARMGINFDDPETPP